MMIYHGSPHADRLGRKNWKRRRLASATLRPSQFLRFVPSTLREWQARWVQTKMFLPWSSPLNGVKLRTFAAVSPQVHHKRLADAKVGTSNRNGNTWKILHVRVVNANLEYIYIYIHTYICTYIQYHNNYFYICERASWPGQLVIWGLISRIIMDCLGTWWIMMIFSPSFW